MTRGRQLGILTIAATALLAGYVLFRSTRPGAEPSAISTGTSRAPAQPTASGSGTARAKPKPPLDLPRVMSLPGGWEQPQIFVKSGHWSSCWIEGETTETDFRGRLTAELETETGQGATLAPWGRLINERDVTFPKRETRLTELSFYAPNSYDPPFTLQAYAENQRRRNMRYMPEESLLKAAQLKLALEQNSARQYETRSPVVVLRDHQSLFVVLAGQPNAYRFYGKLGFAAAPHESQTAFPEHQAHYRVVIVDDPQRAALPGNMLDWTTTSVVVWDRYSPTRLTDAQRQAFVDWLHWGGRLIISGPESLETLRGGFLAPYLPAHSGGSVELDDEALRPLDMWAIGEDTAVRSTAWRGVSLVKAAEAETTLSGGDNSPPLVVERRVGRGRIIVTAFRLTQPDLIDWPSYDSFLHGFLLGRPARIWETVQGPTEKNSFARWADNSFWYDPRRTSDFALAARGREAARAPVGEPAVGPGVAGWRDDDGVTAAAKAVLAEEAGLTIPRVGYVLSVVGAYLVVLVPVNWLVFRAWGKPEWAWAAAPAIALAFSAFVIQSAQLDIGFVRSGQEIIVVEMQPAYDRAHVARWAAVYNSLGSEYTFTSTEPTALALPMMSGGQAANDAGSQQLWRDEGQASSDEPRAALADLQVESNSTEFYRAEQLLPCGGTISLETLADERCRLRNGTPWELTDVRVEGTFTARAPNLPAGAEIVVPMESGPSKAAKNATNRDRFRAAVASLPGDSLRLTAWTTAVPVELTIKPRLSQTRTTTLVVAHLKYPQAARERDRNLPQGRIAGAPND